MGDERAYWLAWSRIKGVGPVLLKRLLHRFGTLEAAWQAPPAALLEVDGIGLMLADQIQTQRSQIHPAQQLENHLHHSPQFLTPADGAYPPLLLEIADPPPVLYYRGRLDLLQRVQQGVGVGIVGTRSPSPYGIRWTRRLTQALVQQGAVIVSGLAQGIDREAHQQTLQQGGDTIAVLGTGVDQVYPMAHRALQQAIATDGLVLSEYADGTAPDRSHFPRRNRIIAGLSRITLVTEAPSRSGALITARLANDYGRDVYALPGSLDNAISRGCLELIAQGAHPVMDEGTLPAALGTLPTLDRRAPATTPLDPVADGTADVIANLAPDLAQVFAAIPTDPATLDQLVQQLPLATATVLSALVQLELLGLVHQEPGMRYGRGG